MTAATAAPTPTLSPALARVSYQSAVAALWAWWTWAHGGGILRRGGTGGYGGGHGGFGGSNGSGGRPGRR